MGPKKKKTKKQEQKEAEEAHRLAQLEAEEKLRSKLARLEEIRRIEEEAKLKEKNDVKEHKVRQATLSINTKLFHKIKSDFINDRIKLRELDDWNRYLRCDRLPYPNVASSMNTHLAHWSGLKESEYMDNILDWVEKYIVLISDLVKLIEDPLDASINTIQNWKEVRDSYRCEIFKKFDQGTFHILRKIQTEMNRIDYWTVDYKRSTKNVKISMWAWLKFPISELNKRSPPTVDFSEIGVTVRLPYPYDKKFVVVRIIHVTFDPLSDTSKSWEHPPLIQEGNLVEIVNYWYQNKIETEKLRWQEEAKKLELEKNQLTIEEGGELETEKMGQKETALESAIKEETNVTSTTKRVSLTETGDTVRGEISVQQERSYYKFSIDSASKPKNLSGEHSEKIMEICDFITEHFSEEIHTYYQHELEINFDYNIKEDILDCMFKVKSKGKASDEARAPLRQIILESNLSVVKYGLKSLHIPKDILKKIYTYFNRLPLFDITTSEELTTSLSPLYDKRQTVIMNKLRRALTIEMLPNETNLRKFTILGGIYYFDLINQIEQRFPLKDGSFVQIQYGNYEIERDDFIYIYEPPKIVETNEDEEEKPPPDDNIDKLIHVEISLPENILWFEAPAPVLWHSAEKMWSNQHVYDVRFNEEKQRIMFKVGRTLPIGLSAVRYNNLPFQTWELRPSPNSPNTVLFSLTASTVIMEFAIKGDKVSLDSLQNATGSALESIIGKFHPPNELIRIMKRTGVDVFPGNDAFLHIEGHSVKDYILEEHVYMCIAIFAPFFQFSWSRWNMLAGWGTLVYQARQAHSKKHLPNYSMVMSNLFRTTFVACSEVSPAFTEQSIPNIGFHADLYSLLKKICPKKVKQLINEIEVDLINTTFTLISRTKFFSYS